MTPSLTLTTQAAQLAALKADLLANSNTILVGGSPTAISAVASMPNRNDVAPDVAVWYNAARSPDYWAWRTKVTKDEYTQKASQDGTTFNWTGTGFITRSQGERDAWVQLFSSTLAVNPSLANVRQAFSDIFSGATAPAPANRAHLMATSRRKMSRAEHLFRSAATGPGNDGVSGNRGLTTNPDWFGPEGDLTAAEVTAAWNLP